MATKVVQGTCTICHEFCGFELTVENGKITKLKPAANHPNHPCPKGLRALDYMYHPDRLLYPLKRTGERGEGKWERISWDEALDAIATNLKTVKEKYGP